MRITAESICVVLPAEPGPAVAGLSLAERNRRVIAREGALLAAAGPDRAAARWILNLLPGVALDRGFVADLSAVEQPVLLVGVLPGGTVPLGVWGRAGDVATVPLTADAPELARREIPARGFLDVSSPVARRAAQRELLRRTGKASDGPVSRLVNRPVSRWFSVLFLAAGLRPIHASAVSLLIGLASATCAAMPVPWGFALAGALFQFASVFDGVDGELARVTLSESPRGALIDTAIDNLTYLACLSGFFIGWYREGLSPADLTLLVFLLVALPLSLGWVALMVRRHGRDGSMLHFTVWLASACRQPECPAGLRFANALFPLTRRDAAALVLMAVSFTGSRELLVLLVLFGLLLGDYVLLFHRHRLVAMATAGHHPVKSAGA